MLLDVKDSARVGDNGHNAHPGQGLFNLQPHTWRVTEIEDGNQCFLRRVFPCPPVAGKGGSPSQAGGIPGEAPMCEHHGAVPTGARSAATGSKKAPPTAPEPPAPAKTRGQRNQRPLLPTLDPARCPRARARGEFLAVGRLSADSAPGPGPCLWPGSFPVPGPQNPGKRPREPARDHFRKTMPSPCQATWRSVWRPEWLWPAESTDGQLPSS